MTKTSTKNNKKKKTEQAWQQSCRNENDWCENEQNHEETHSGKM